MNKDKPKWDKPQLIVLVRNGNSPEKVLLTCKILLFTGPVGDFTEQCFLRQTELNPCVPCSDMVSLT